MRRAIAGVLTVTGLAWAASAFAVPRTGVGVMGGFAAHAFEIRPNGGTAISGSSSGTSLGLDFQLAYPRQMSFNLILLTSTESPDGNLGSTYSEVDHGALAAQFRYWFDNWFLGAQAGNAYQISSLKAGGSTATGVGLGLGVLGGGELESGLFFVCQIDAARVTYGNGNGSFEGVRLQVGQRFR
jgi:hypothetical protein